MRSLAPELCKWVILWSAEHYNDPFTGESMLTMPTAELHELFASDSKNYWATMNPHPE